MPDACITRIRSQLLAFAQGATTIRIPVARYHSSHGPLGPRPIAVAPAQGEHVEPHAEAPLPPTEALHAEAPLPPSEAGAGADVAQDVVGTAPHGADVIPSTSAEAVRCNPPPTVECIARPAPAPVYAQREQDGRASTSTDAVKGEEDHNLTNAKLETLFSKTMVSMTKADLCSLAVRSFSWLYVGVVIDEWLLCHLPACDVPLQTATYRAIGLGHSSQSKCKGLAWLETTHPELSKAVLASDEIMAATPSLKKVRGEAEKPPSEFLSVRKGGAFHNSGGLRPYMKVIKEAFVDVAIFHALRVCDGQPPPGFGMRMHKSNDASGDVAWSWNIVVKSCPPEGQPLTFVASCYLWAWLTSGVASTGRSISWYTFMRAKVLPRPHDVPLVVTTPLEDNISVRLSTTTRHAPRRGAVRQSDTFTPARRKLVANALPGEMSRPLKRPRKHDVSPKQYALTANFT